MSARRASPPGPAQRPLPLRALQTERFGAAQFEGRLVVGLITKWAPASGEDAAIWHMVHDDGDEEDLDEAEMHAAIALLKHEHGGPAREESASRAGRKRTQFNAAALQGKRQKT